MSVVKRITTTFAIVLAFVVMVTTLVVTPVGTAYADDNESDKWSFYSISSAAATAYSTSLDPSSESGASSVFVQAIGDGSGGRIGMAGAFLGYYDSDASGGIGSWLYSALSTASTSADYTALGAINTSEPKTLSTQRAFVGYGLYGSLLTSLGLDSTGTNSTYFSTRFFPAAIMMILFTISLSVDALFAFALQVLVWTNPFSLFYSAVDSSLRGYLSTPKTGAITGGLQEFIRGWYGALTTFSWAVMVPLFVVFLGITIIFYKKVNKGSKVKLFLIRLGFIVLGVPLIGGLYTGALTQLEREFSDEPWGFGAAKVVNSTYVSFDKWVTDYHLALPVPLQYNSAVKGPDHVSISQLRGIALIVNDMGGTVGTNFSASQAVKELSAGSGTGRSSFTSVTNPDRLSNTYDMLTKYMRSQQFSAGDYETIIKGGLSRYIKNDDNRKKKVEKWFEELSQPDSDAYQNEGDAAMSINPLIKADKLYYNGSTQGENIGGSFSSSNGFKKCSYVGEDGNFDETANCSMSPLAMYNYLSTKFQPTSMVVYSNARSVSDFSRESHYSVNQIGTGIMGMLYWFNSVILLGAFVVIGWGYAIGLIVSNFKRGLMLIGSIPFGMIGSIKAIAKVVTYSVVMIIELFLTFVLYIFVQEFLISLPVIIETPLQELVIAFTGRVSGSPSAMNSVPGLSMMASADAATLLLFSSPLILLLSIVLTLFIAITGLRVRKVVLKAVNDTALQTINKFMETNAAPTQASPGLLSKGVGALATGAGMAAGSKLFGAATGGGKSDGGVFGGMVSSPDAEGVSGTDAGEQDGGALESGGGTPQIGPPGEGDGGGTFINASMSGDGDSMTAVGGEGADGGDGANLSGTLSGDQSQDAFDKELSQNVLNMGSLDGGGHGGGVGATESGPVLTQDSLDGKDSLSAQLKTTSGSLDSTKDEPPVNRVKQLGKAVEGGVKVAAGSYTGNVSMAVDGAQDLQQAQSMNKSSQRQSSGGMGGQTSVSTTNMTNNVGGSTQGGSSQVNNSNMTQHQTYKGGGVSHTSMSSQYSQGSQSHMTHVDQSYQQNTNIEQTRGGGLKNNMTKTYTGNTGGQAPSAPPKVLEPKILT